MKDNIKQVKSFVTKKVLPKTESLTKDLMARIKPFPTKDLEPKDESPTQNDEAKSKVSTTNEAPHRTESININIMQTVERIKSFEPKKFLSRTQSFTKSIGQRFKSFYGEEVPPKTEALTKNVWASSKSSTPQKVLPEKGPDQLPKVAEMGLKYLSINEVQHDKTPIQFSKVEVTRTNSSDTKVQIHQETLDNPSQPNQISELEMKKLEVFYYKSHNRTIDILEKALIMRPKSSATRIIFPWNGINYSVDDFNPDATEGKVSYVDLQSFFWILSISPYFNIKQYSKLWITLGLTQICLMLISIWLTLSSNALINAIRVFDNYLLSQFFLCIVIIALIHNLFSQLFQLIQKKRLQSLNVRQQELERIINIQNHQTFKSKGVKWSIGKLGAYLIMDINLTSVPKTKKTIVNVKSQQTSQLAKSLVKWGVRSTLFSLTGSVAFIPISSQLVSIFSNYLSKEILEFQTVDLLSRAKGLFTKQKINFFGN